MQEMYAGMTMAVNDNKWMWLLHKWYEETLFVDKKWNQVSMCNVIIE